jgi:hypothetical protein
MERTKIFNVKVHMAREIKNNLMADEKILCYKSEGPEEVTRGGVNESQSKFLTETWPMSQNQPETHLFCHDRDRLAIDKLSTLEAGLGTTAETRNGARKNA